MIHQNVQDGSHHGPAVRVLDPDTGDRLGDVLNLSRAGLLVVAERAFPERQRYRLALCEADGDPGPAVELTAESIYCEPSAFSHQHGVGFAIIEVHAGDLARLFPAIGDARFGIPA